MSEAWGPRAHPERCDEFPSADRPVEERILLRLTLTMIGGWGLCVVAGVSAFLLLRWLWGAGWVSGCPA